MTEEKYSDLAELFKVFGDVTRIKIMSVLLEGELSVGEISEKLSMSPSAISHQLNILRRSKLVKTRREGKSVYYSLDDEHVYEIISCGIEHISEGDG
jgi:ArsR family transcriptional regulator